ncbi:MAG: hypothetical protein ACYS8X_14580, partial [Planctomycetota bacterium]
GGKEELDKVMAAHKFVKDNAKQVHTILGDATPWMQDRHWSLQLEYQWQMDILREAKKKGYKVDLDEFPERLPDLHETGGGEPTIAEYLVFGASLYGGGILLKAAAPYVGPTLKALQGLAVRSGPAIVGITKAVWPRVVTAMQAGATHGVEFYHRANVVLMRLEAEYPRLVDFFREIISAKTPKGVSDPTRNAALAILVTEAVDYVIDNYDQLKDKIGRIWKSDASPTEGATAPNGTPDANKAAMQAILPNELIEEIVAAQGK